jgi:hypothetical protein
MPTQAISTPPRRRARLVTAIMAAAVGAVAGVLATTTFISHGAADVRPVTTVVSHTATVPFSADAAEHWLTPDIPIPCSTRAPHRRQIPRIAAIDLPFTADAAEHWICAP